MTQSAAECYGFGFRVEYGEDVDIIDIEQIKDRDKILGVFLVQQKSVPLNKNGKPYISAVLMNRTGLLDGKVWDNVEQMSSRFEAGDFVEVRATAVAYQHKIQLKIEWMERVDPSGINTKDFLPASSHSIDKMLKQVMHLLNSIKSTPLRKFLSSWLQEDDFVESFTNAPAAKSIHHAFLGGLLEHTLSVMQLADKICEVYSHLDRDLLLAGAFLHDLGKMHELERERSFEYTDEGRLLGHIVMGSFMLEQRAKNHPGLDREMVLMLNHMILSHHGSLEFGSPKRPKFKEALMLNYLDEVDAKLQIFSEIANQEPGHKWSSYQRLFDRYLLLGKPEVASQGKSKPTQPSQEAKDKSSPPGKVLDLFSGKFPGSDT